MTEVHLTQDLADALAAEEHRQGLAYGDHPDHCGDCKREAFLRLQAECEHANVGAADMTSVGDSGRRYVAYCQDCGLKLNGVTGAW